jgi:hypothetical protein
MGIPPIGNSANTYPTLFQAGNSERVRTATQVDKPEIYPQACKTCESRKYVDQSSDPSVSFQSPTHLSVGEAALAVAAHENEHVANNREKAEQAGMTARSTVTIAYGVCPECGRIYVAGGKTETTFTPKEQTDDATSSGLGGNVNTFA